jgi:tetratricopeptide (TPR) repeat protein
MKAEWMKGEMHTTRKLLNQYLLLCPEDEEADELKKVIHELDLEFSEDFKDKEKATSNRPSMQMLYKQAGELIQKLEFERAIGIFEGIIEDFPQSTGSLREQIGDIRILQKDYQSALWNFNQALAIVPERTELKDKIDKIKGMQKVPVVES